MSDHNPEEKNRRSTVQNLIYISMYLNSEIKTPKFYFIYGILKIRHVSCRHRSVSSQPPPPLPSLQDIKGLYRLYPSSKVTLVSTR